MSDQQMSKTLVGKVALVTGASRGIGKGIAIALAREGAIVYVTGRTVKEGDYYLPGTVGQTAQECSDAGGNGIAVACDHADDDQVAALFARIGDEQGRLDILVNNAFLLSDDLIEPGGFGKSPCPTSKCGTWACGQTMSPRGTQHRSWSRKRAG